MGMLSHRRFLLQQIPTTRKNEQMAPSLLQLLNGQGVQEISDFRPEYHGIRFSRLNVGSLDEGKQKCVKN